MRESYHDKENYFSLSIKSKNFGPRKCDKGQIHIKKFGNKTQGLITSLKNLTINGIDERKSRRKTRWDQPRSKEDLSNKNVVQEESFNCMSSLNSNLLNESTTDSLMSEIFHSSDIPTNSRRNSTQSSSKSPRSSTAPYVIKRSPTYQNTSRHYSKYKHSPTATKSSSTKKSYDIRCYFQQIKSINKHSLKQQQNQCKSIPMEIVEVPDTNAKTCFLASQSNVIEMEETTTTTRDSQISEKSYLMEVTESTPFLLNTANGSNSDAIMNANTQSSQPRTVVESSENHKIARKENKTRIENLKYSDETSKIAQNNKANSETPTRKIEEIQISSVALSKVKQTVFNRKIIKPTYGRMRKWKSLSELPTTAPQFNHCKTPVSLKVKPRPVTEPRNKRKIQLDHLFKDDYEPVSSNKKSRNGRYLGKNCQPGSSKTDRLKVPLFRSVNSPRCFGDADLGVIPFSKDTKEVRYHGAQKSSASSLNCLRNIESKTVFERLSCSNVNYCHSCSHCCPWSCSNNRNNEDNNNNSCQTCNHHCTCFPTLRKHALTFRRYATCLY